MTQRRDPARVDKVIRVVGTSTVSWAAAARAVVDDASKSIRDLGQARVVEHDVRVTAHGTSLYRVALEITFQLDRGRANAAGDRLEVHRYLIVANHTLGTAELRTLVQARLLRGVAEFHVVAPTAPYPAVSALVLGSPMGGYVGPDVMSAYDTAAATQQAQERLEAFIHDLVLAGASATGEIGVSNPLDAVRQVLERATFDEIVVSTLPSTMSRWLRMDLPSRLRRITSVPVTHVETAPPP